MRRHLRLRSEHLNTYFVQHRYLLFFSLVMPPAHLVDTGQVPRAREQQGPVAGRRVGRAVQRLAPDVQRVRELFGREPRPPLQAGRDGHPQAVHHGGQTVVRHRDRVHGRRQTGPVREHADPLAGQPFGRHRQQVRRQSAVHGRRVRVADARRQHQRRSGLGLENGPAAVHRGSLIRAGRSLLGRGSRLAGRIFSVQPGQSFAHQFAVRRVKHERIERAEAADRVAPLAALAPVRLVAPVQGVQIAPDGQLAVHHRVLGAQVGLVEIVRVVHVRAPQAPVDHQRGARADEHGHGAGAARRTGAAAGRVHRYVGGHHHGQPAVPRARLGPGQGVEQGRRAAVTRVRRVDALHAVVAGGREQLHHHRFRALRLVHQRLGAHLQAADVRVAETVVLDQLTDGRQAQRVHVLEVRAESHLLLAQTDRVLALGYPVVPFQVGLVHVQRRYDDVHGAYPDVLWPMPVVHRSMKINSIGT